MWSIEKEVVRKTEKDVKTFRFCYQSPLYCLIFLIHWLLRRWSHMHASNTNWYETDAESILPPENNEEPQILAWHFQGKQSVGLTIRLLPRGASLVTIHQSQGGFLQHEKAREVKEKEQTVNPFCHHHRTEWNVRQFPFSSLTNGEAAGTR